MTPTEARAKHAERPSRRRLDEARCAWDFLVHGDENGSHSAVCVFALRGEDACSRDYDPGPPPEDERMYRDSALGTLWGLNDTEAWQLAGWNVKRRRRA